MSKVHPSAVLAELLAATYRPERKKALQELYSLCEAQAAGSVKDFSTATIGKVAWKLGILGKKTLSNKKQSAALISLIESWSAYAGGDRVQAPSLERSALTEKLLTIPDPALRVLIQSQLAERDRLVAQVNLLKASTKLTVDLRSSGPEVGVGGPDGQKLPRLRDSELAALRAVIAPKFLLDEGWTEGSHGEIIASENGRQIFPKGFLSALRKICGESDGC